MPVTNQALPSGYQLLNYRIDRQISRGGFSIVYRAFDETGTPVAIKEYLPSDVAVRVDGTFEGLARDDRAVGHDVAGDDRRAHAGRHRRAARRLRRAAAASRAALLARQAGPRDRHRLDTAR